MREEHRLRVFEDRVLRTTFGRRKDEVTGKRKNYRIRRLMICILHQILFG